MMHLDGLTDVDGNPFWFHPARTKSIILFTARLARTDVRISLQGGQEIAAIVNRGMAGKLINFLVSGSAALMDERTEDSSQFILLEDPRVENGIIQAVNPAFVAGANLCKSHVLKSWEAVSVYYHDSSRDSFPVASPSETLHRIAVACRVSDAHARNIASL